MEVMVVGQPSSHALHSRWNILDEDKVELFECRW